MVVDSLRRSQAVGPSALDSLARLRNKALLGHLEGCLPATTLPCIRTMFEGNNAGYGAGLENFTAGRAGVGAWPMLVAQAGLRVGAVSDHTYRRLFEDDLTLVVDHGRDGTPYFERDEATVTIALDWLENREVDVVLVHLLELDKASHVYSPSEPEYQERLARTDRLIQRTIDALGPDDTLIVVGDHGHDDDGAHNPETGYLALGPSFVPGRLDIDQPTVALLLAAASGTPLPKTYEGGIVLEHITPDRVAALTGPGDADGLETRSEEQKRSRLQHEKEDLAVFLPVMLLATLALGWATGLSRRRDIMAAAATVSVLAAASVAVGYTWGQGGRNWVWMSGFANVLHYVVVLVVVVTVLAAGIRRVSDVRLYAAMGAALLAVPMVVHLPGLDYYASVYAGVHLLAPACILLLAPALPRPSALRAVLVALVTAVVFRVGWLGPLDGLGVGGSVGVTLAGGTLLGRISRPDLGWGRLAGITILALALVLVLEFKASQVAGVALLLSTFVLVSKELHEIQPRAPLIQGVLAAMIAFLTLWAALGKWTIGSVSFSFAFPFVIDHPVEWVVALQVTALTVPKYLLVAILIVTVWPLRTDPEARTVALAAICLKPMLAALWVVGARLDMGSRHQDQATEETLLIWCTTVLFVVAVGLTGARKAGLMSTPARDR
jgi:hypothetical protein